jgi:hypothetical protein
MVRDDRLLHLEGAARCFLSGNAFSSTNFLAARYVGNYPPETKPSRCPSRGTAVFYSVLRRTWLLVHLEEIAYDPDSSGSAIYESKGTITSCAANGIVEFLNGRTRTRNEREGHIVELLTDLYLEIQNPE